MLRRLMMAGNTSASGYLDALSVSPIAVHSLNKLISSATNSIRVRRSSDNTEQDIGFAGNVLDTSSLLAFVGSGDGFVRTVYDQTGGGFNMEQATTTNQPKIVSAGSYLSGVTFDGTSSWMKILALTMGNPQAAIYSKISIANPSSLKIVIESTTNYNNGNGAFVFYYNTNNVLGLGMSNAAASSIRAQDYNLGTTPGSQLSLLYDRTLLDGAQEKVWMDGVSVPLAFTEATTAQTGTFGSNDVYVGARAGSSYFANFHLENLVFYRDDTALIRTSIEAAVA